MNRGSQRSRLLFQNEVLGPSWLCRPRPLPAPAVPKTCELSRGSQTRPRELLQSSLALQAGTCSSVWQAWGLLVDFTFTCCPRLLGLHLSFTRLSQRGRVAPDEGPRPARCTHLVPPIGELALAQWALDTRPSPHWRQGPKLGSPSIPGNERAKPLSKRERQAQRSAQQAGDPQSRFASDYTEPAVKQ